MHGLDSLFSPFPFGEFRQPIQQVIGVGTH